MCCWRTYAFYTNFLKSRLNFILIWLGNLYPVQPREVFKSSNKQISVYITMLACNVEIKMWRFCVKHLYFDTFIAVYLRHILEKTIQKCLIVFLHFAKDYNHICSNFISCVMVKVPLLYYRKAEYLPANTRLVFSQMISFLHVGQIKVTSHMDTLWISDERETSWV